VGLPSVKMLRCKGAALHPPCTSCGASGNRTSSTETRDAMEKVNLAEKFSRFSHHWEPKRSMVSTSSWSSSRGNSFGTSTRWKMSFFWSCMVPSLWSCAIGEFCWKRGSSSSCRGESSIVLLPSRKCTSCSLSRDPQSTPVARPASERLSNPSGSEEQSKSERCRLLPGGDFKLMRPRAPQEERCPR
jgi:hypothetical protein